ncbi:MAG: SLC13 family permease [Verrucomicrobia bacterium]|nr:SLC13 family permease [Verrucomicrobiota bacterium]
MPDASLLDLTWQAWLTLGTIITVLGVLICTRLPADFVFLGGLGVLLLSGVLKAEEALAGFGSAGLVTVGVLYIVVAGLQETGGLTWISRNILGHPKSRTAAQVRMMAPVIALSAFLNNTPVVAMFIPIVTEWCRRIRVQPSQMMIPLSYASIFGGICTLIGTSTNLVVNGLVQERYHTAGLTMFEISKLGIPCAIVGMLYVIGASRRLLPNRKTLTEVFENPREYTLEMQVSPGSALTGKTIDDSGLRHLPGAYLAELMRSDQVVSAVSPDEILQDNDRLVFVGNVDSMRTLYNQQGLRPAPDQLFKLDAPRHQRCLVEAVVSDVCPLVGKTIRESHFRSVYNAVVIAVARNGERVAGKIGDITLRAGDTLLVESHAGFIPRQRDSRDFYLISEVADSTPRRFEKAPMAFAILLLMVVVVTAGWMTMLNAALVAAGLMIATGCCSAAKARQNVEWHVLLTIAAALGLAYALEITNAASVLAGILFGLTREDPWLALAVVYLTTTIFTEVITNNAAAALIFPIAMNTAERLDVSTMPFIMCIMVAASASFSTPIGYQTNLMVYGAGGYRFGDYLRIGVPLNLIMGIVAVGLAPWIWPF